MGKLCWMGIILAILLCGCGKIPPPESPILETQVTEITQETAPTLTFPCALSGGMLVAEKLVRYDGVFWEKEGAEPVTGVAGLMLYNPTPKMVEFASVVVNQGSQKLYFFVYQLPPMSRCLVAEYNQATYMEQPVTQCQELSVRWDTQDYSRGPIDYLGYGPRLTVINRDSRVQNSVTVWYKQYVKEGEYYLGGGVQAARLFFLQPEQRKNLYPEYYHTASAKIVAIKTDV